MRILFVEDDADLGEILGRKLKEEFKGVVDIASSGKEAMKILREEKPYDVIVSD
jgi:DNA-binding response OmpR family regulator